MKDIVVFGTGRHFENHKMLLEDDWNIVAFADNNKEKWGKMYKDSNIKIINPQELIDGKDYDYIVIASTAKIPIVKQLVDMGIPVTKIKYLNCFKSLSKDEVSVTINEDGTALYEINGTKYKCITQSDFNVIQELFDAGPYNYVDYNNEFDVIDVGMNVGIATLMFANRKNVINVYGYEPFKDTYDQALDNFALNPDISGKIHSFNYALGAEDCVRKCKYSADMSECNTIEEADKDDNLLEIEIKDAGDALEDIIDNSQNSIILKMDCEGSEYEIIPALDKKGLMKKIDVLLLEWHELDKNNIIEDILVKNNLKYVKYCKRDTIGLLYAFK